MDNVPPPTPRRMALTLIVVASVALVGVLLFGGYLPGLKPNYAMPTTLEFDGRPYYYDEYTLPIPIWPANSTGPSAVDFHNHTFAIWVTSYYAAAGPVVHGNVSEANGSYFVFALGNPPSLPQRTNLSISADWEVGAYWDGLMTYVILLVLAPTTA